MKVFSSCSLFLALIAAVWALVPAVATSIGSADVGRHTIAIFGGTGQTGRECVYQALKANHKVVVLARDPSKMKIPPGSGGSLADQPLVDKNLHIIQGDVTDPKSVDAVFDAHKDITGVIVALGGRTKDVGPTMLSQGTQNIVNSMKAKSKAKRIAALTVIGTGDSAGQAPWKFKILMHTVMRSIFADKNRQEKIFLDPNGSGHDLEYCIVRPGGLGTGAPTGVVNVVDGKAGSIHRADLATFLLSAVIDKNFPYLRKTPGLSSVGGTSWTKDGGKDFDKPTEL